MTDAETPLAEILKAEIGTSGPMPVSAFMARALTDPDHGYYTTATPFGVEGDFITAPEVSQLFGEIAGGRKLLGHAFFSTFCSIAPKMEWPALSFISMRTVSPKRRNGVFGPPPWMVSMVRISAMQE